MAEISNPGRPAPAIPVNKDLHHGRALEASSLIVRLASPRGFCAGVERAVRSVEDALTNHGAPVFVRHEIVHNAHVVNRLEAMGAIFIDHLTDADPARPVIFSAHGAPRAAHEQAERLGLAAIDATCPLVLKVHNQTRRYVSEGRHVLLVGHAGHPEVIGTIGQAGPGEVSLIETLDDAKNATPPSGPLAYVTQTTLSVEDTSNIVVTLKQRFPEIAGPRKADICYATSNRQTAVKAIAPGVDFFIVIGSPSSSNSLRLVETAKSAGAKHAMLVNDPSQFDLSVLRDVNSLGLSSGASAPEELVERMLARLADAFDLRIETVETAQENVAFKPPAMKLAS